MQLDELEKKWYTVRDWLTDIFQQSKLQRCLNIFSPTGHHYQQGPILIKADKTAVFLLTCRFCGNILEHKVEDMMLNSGALSLRREDIQ